MTGTNLGVGGGAGAVGSGAGVRRNNLLSG